MVIEGTIMQNQRLTARVESLITSDDQLESALGIVFGDYEALVRQIRWTALNGSAEYPFAV